MIVNSYDEGEKNIDFTAWNTLSSLVFKLLQRNKKNMICLREHEQAVFQGYKSR